MRNVTLTAAALAFAALGGLSAQAATSAPTAAPGTAATTVKNEAGAVRENSQAMAAADQNGMAPMTIRQQLAAKLAKDGYSGVTITPSSFFVRAKDKNGDPVAMVIGPDTFETVTEIVPKAAASSPAAPAASAPEATQPAPTAKASPKG